MTTMKGLLKGIRYISQIFDNEKEREMEIGHPTDVKHVAHIGWEGPSATTPSWMNEFRSTTEVSSSVPSYGEANGNLATKSALKEMQKSSGSLLDSPTRGNSGKTKQSRRHKNSGDSTGSPTQGSLGTTTKPRRHKNKSGGGVDSPTRESPSNRGRQVPSWKLGSELPSQDLPRVTKESRRKKSKDSSGGGGSHGSYGPVVG